MTVAAVKAWAAENYSDTLAFWEPFADKVCAIIRRCGWDSVEGLEARMLYDEYEEHGESVARRYAFEGWM